MLEFLFFWTRFYLLNFGSLWALPVAAFLCMLFFRAFILENRPCRGLLLGLPAAYLVVSIVNAWLIAVDNVAMLGWMGVLGRVEPLLFFGWLGLLLGTVIGRLLPKREGEATHE